MVKIFDRDNKLLNVTTIEQALFHLKLMHSVALKSLQQDNDEEEMMINRVQAQAMKAVIDYIEQNNQAESCKWVSSEEHCKRNHYKSSGSTSWYCPYCGAVSSYRFNFCHRCGKRLNGDDEIID